MAPPPLKSDIAKNTNKLVKTKQNFTQKSNKLKFSLMFKDKNHVIKNPKIVLLNGLMTTILGTTGIQITRNLDFSLKSSVFLNQGFGKKNA